MNNKIAILGSYETVAAFKALGVDVYDVYEEKEAENKIKEIYDKKEYVILLISEDWFFKLESKIKDFYKFSFPAVIPIPTVYGSSGLAEKELSKIIERAVGKDIFLENKNL